MADSGLCQEFGDCSKKIWRYLEATQIKFDERERYRFFRHISKAREIKYLHDSSSFFCFVGFMCPPKKSTFCSVCTFCYINI